MVTNQVLMISRDASLAGKVREELDSLGGLNLRVVDGVDKAFSEAIEGEQDLILAHLDAGIDRAQLGWMIGEVGIRSLPVPFVALSETYRADEAISLFRMGVADYLSRADHLDKIATVINSLTCPSQEADERLVAADHSPSPFA